MLLEFSRGMIDILFHRVGKVFDVDELREIGRIAKEHDLIILADEVVSSTYIEPSASSYNLYYISMTA